MYLFARSFVAPRAVRSGLKFGLCLILFFSLFNNSQAHAGATLLLQEPYSLDGALAGTGHAAVYLDHVCAVTPVQLRPCKPGETGIVLSRYHAIAGYDWIAIPLIPYLYAVEKKEDVPLFADAKLAAFLRDQYRRKYLEGLVPDRPDGSTPEGEWYELIGASYIRTIYGFEIETTPEQDAALIQKLNSHPNHRQFSLVTNNCADFAREVIDFYYPHSVHRNVILDLGVTTPKQLAKNLAKYSHRHPELESLNFVIPQVPGSIRRSKPIHGVVESALSAKKYMVPLLVLHPYISGGVLAVYFGHPHFKPAQHAMVVDSRWQLEAPATTADRRSYQSQLEELKQTSSALASVSDPSTEGKSWEQLQAGAEPELDSSGTPAMRVRVGNDVETVGMSRANVLNDPGSSGLAAKLLEARIQQELHAAHARKSALSDVARDVGLLRQLLAIRQNALTQFPFPSESNGASRIQAAVATQQ